MNPASAMVPIEKHVVLVGAGNAHLGFVKRFGMHRLSAVAVTLISETAVVPYSAMVPGFIARDYGWDEITIDLVRLCQASMVRFIPARVEAIDPILREVRFAHRPPLKFDALSLGVGSLPACPESLARDPRSLMMRPMAALTLQLDGLEADLTREARPFHFVVVGGGVSGCELAVAVHKRFARFADFRVTLLQGDSRLLPAFPAKAAQLFQNVLHERGIQVRTQARVIGVSGNALTIDAGDQVPFDAVLWATQAAPTSLLRQSGLPVDSRGFLKVLPTLQSADNPAIFGTGDCVDFEAYPDLLKNGVHAVRQGAVLFDNVASFLSEQPLRPFQPQRFCLCLMNTADDQAILNYGPFTFKTRWARKLKDRIDRRWVAMHAPAFIPESRGAAEAASPQMRCGGCGNKVSADVLSAVLKRIAIPEDPRVLLGTRAGEDAAVHRVRPELFGTEPEKLLEVQTVDYFKAFVDDPYLFGRIAALNSVSDLFAMNARPFSALAIATLPYARGPIQEAQLFELLSGAVEAFRELDVVLTGGHTTEGPELALGFAVTGFAEEGKLFQKGNLKVGDVLIVTKPLGSGALLAAWMRGACRALWYEPMLRAMLTSNREAGKIFAEIGVTACTDVTGFGLAGHLLEMLDASIVSARLEVASVPVYEGFDAVVAQGIVSTLHEDNAKASCRVVGSSLPAWLFDPQTSGGLIAGVRPERVEETLRRLHAAGCTSAASIGEIVPIGDDAGPTIQIRSRSLT